MNISEKSDKCNVPSLQKINPNLMMNLDRITLKRLSKTGPSLSNSHRAFLQDLNPNL